MMQCFMTHRTFTQQIRVYFLLKYLNFHKLLYIKIIISEGLGLNTITRSRQITEYSYIQYNTWSVSKNINPGISAFQHFGSLSSFTGINVLTSCTQGRQTVLQFSLLFKFFSLSGFFCRQESLSSHMGAVWLTLQEKQL